MAIPSNKKKYHIGQKENRCTFLEETESKKYSDGSVIRKGLFQCDCGKQFITGLRDVLSKKTTKSCGCLKQEKFKELVYKHGKAKSSEHTCWNNIKSRCNNIANKAYKNYGGRGIRVCKEWEDSFEIFLNDMGNKPSKSYSIERINVDGDYCKENCKWATRLEQSRNKRNNVLLEYNNEIKTIKDWAIQYNMDRMTLKWRLGKGMSIEEALTTPIDLRFKLKNKKS